MTQTIKTPTGSEVSFSPEKGGLITSLKIRGVEVLYSDEERGGIPILFPNAGIVMDPRFPNLKRHGFARDSKNWRSVVTTTGFKETLQSTKETHEVYPYDFELSLECSLDEHGVLLQQGVTNTGHEEELPIAMGLHPYFKVPTAEKKNIVFDFADGEIVTQQFELWANGETVIIDNPGVMKITVPSLGTLTINASSEYQKIWVWSLPGKDFICIEPVLRDISGLTTDPKKISPGKSFTTQLQIDLI